MRFPWFTRQRDSGPNDPLYPFGYGLSYTTFAYSEVSLNKEAMTREDVLHVSVNVTYVGTCAGEEVVQLYIQDLYGSTVKTVKELKGFQKIFLESGAGCEVCFDITIDDLKFFTANGKYEAEAGTFKVYVGGNSKEVIKHVAGNNCEASRKRNQKCSGTILSMRAMEQYRPI